MIAEHYIQGQSGQGGVKYEAKCGVCGAEAKTRRPKRSKLSIHAYTTAWRNCNMSERG